MLQWTGSSRITEFWNRSTLQNCCRFKEKSKSAGLSWRFYMRQIHLA
jgi:hypothetical protein